MKVQVPTRERPSLFWPVAALLVSLWVLGLMSSYLCLKLRALLPQQRILVGLWGVTENVADAARRVRASGADEVVTTLAGALLQLAKLAPMPAVQTPAGPIRAKEQAASG
jgi:hypothetical protein